MQTIGETFNFDFKSPEMIHAQKIHSETVSKLDAERKAWVELVRRFFANASDAYAASMRTDLSEKTQTLLPGTKAGNAVVMFDLCKEYLSSRGMASDERAVIDTIQQTREWLETAGWTVLPRDFTGEVIYKTTAGVLKNMRSFASDAEKVRGIMAKEIDARKKGGKR